MIRAIRAIYNGLIGFFKLTVTVITWIPKLFYYLWKMLVMLFEWAQYLPDGVYVLAIVALSLGIIFLLSKR